MKGKGETEAIILRRTWESNPMIFIQCGASSDLFMSSLFEVFMNILQDFSLMPMTVLQNEVINESFFNPLDAACQTNLCRVHMHICISLNSPPIYSCNNYSGSVFLRKPRLIIAFGTKTGSGEQNLKDRNQELVL